MRTVPFIGNTCLRLWMDGRGTADTDLQVSCAHVGKAYPFAARLNWQARQTSAERAWLAMARFSKHCREHKPGTQASRRGQAKGSPRFQPDNRSVESKHSGWKLEPDGKRITFTDGHRLGTLRLIGSKKRPSATSPLKQIKRVRLVKRADGSSGQFAVQAERKIAHEAPFKRVGIDVGLKAFSTDSDGTTVENPRSSQQSRKALEAAASARVPQGHAGRVPQTSDQTPGQRLSPGQETV